MLVKRRCVSLSQASTQICRMLTAHARALSTRNVLEGRVHISAHIPTDAASVHHFQVVRCQATLTRVDVTWMSLELPMRDHELEVFCEYGNKLSAQGNNTCSMEFAKLRRRCIVALCLVCIMGAKNHCVRLGQAKHVRQCGWIHLQCHGSTCC